MSAGKNRNSAHLKNPPTPINDEEQYAPTFGCLSTIMQFLINSVEAHFSNKFSDDSGNYKNLLSRPVCCHLPFGLWRLR